MNTEGYGYPVRVPFVIKTGRITEFEVTPEHVKKIKGFFPFTVKAGNRFYDMYVAMFRAYNKEGIPLNDKEWNRAALAVQYDRSHWLKAKYLEYFPNTYDYTKR